MTSILNQNGLTIDNKATIIQTISDAYRAIYGSDINLDSNSPDGQLVNIQAQLIADYLELLLDTYNNFAVLSAYGQRLDELVALNGLQRQEGTYTEAAVLVTASQALTLPGLDQTAVPAFTVADDAGNQFELQESHVFGGAGSATLTFQAVELGQVETTPNTITNIVTSTLGVTSVNNPSTAADSVGVNEETDAQLKVRHARSLALASTGPSDSMEAALKNIPGVVDALVVENNTGGTVNTIPAHSVWPIVRGGTSTEIANAIYAKKAAGTGLKGSVSEIVTRPNGQSFTSQWDVAVAQPLYVKFSIIWRGAPELDNADIAEQLAEALVFRLGQNPSIGDVVQAMAAIAPSAIVTINSATQGVSDDDAIWASVVQPTTAAGYFTLDAGDITIS